MCWKIKRSATSTKHTCFTQVGQLTEMQREGQKGSPAGWGAAALRQTDNLIRAILRRKPLLPRQPPLVCPVIQLAKLTSQFSRCERNDKPCYRQFRATESNQTSVLNHSLKCLFYHSRLLSWRGFSAGRRESRTDKKRNGAKRLSKVLWRSWKRRDSWTSWKKPSQRKMSTRNA